MSNVCLPRSSVSDCPSLDILAIVVVVVVVVVVAAAAYVDLVMFEAEFEVVIDGLVGDFAEEGKIRDTNLLLLCAFKDGLLDLGLARLSPVAHIGGGLGATEAATLLLPASRTS